MPEAGPEHPVGHRAPAVGPLRQPVVGGEQSRPRRVTPGGGGRRCRPLVADTPSATSAASSTDAASGPELPRGTQRLAIVTSSGGTSSANRRNTADAGGSSMTLSSLPIAASSMASTPRTTITFLPDSTGDRSPAAMIRSASLTRIVAPLGLDDDHVGVLRFDGETKVPFGDAGIDLATAGGAARRPG